MLFFIRLALVMVSVHSSKTLTKTGVLSFWANMHLSVSTYYVSSFVIELPHSGWCPPGSSICLGISPHPRQHLLSSEFLILAILTGVRWNLRVVLICISLMIKDVEHFFRCFSAIRYSSGQNSLFSSEPHFLMGLFDFLKSTFLSSLYILDISSLSDLG